jgi:bifunctional non-homologous end joining protein LigD
MKRSPFIVPSSPVLKREPQSGDGYLHEVKFDGWRLQLHKDGDTAALFSRRGNDLTKRFRDVRDAVLALPCRSAIIDAEVVCCDSDGKPDFTALMARSTENLRCWCFDLLSFNGRDLCGMPLAGRKAPLRDLLIAADDDTLRYSDDFEDAEKLLAVAEKMGLEGIVSKKADQPYVSGKNVGWIKVKTSAWRAANKDRFELFDKSRGSRSATGA